MDWWLCGQVRKEARGLPFPHSISDLRGRGGQQQAELWAGNAVCRKLGLVSSSPPSVLRKLGQPEVSYMHLELAFELLHCVRMKRCREGKGPCSGWTGDMGLGSFSELQLAFLTIYSPCQ